MRKLLLVPVLVLVLSILLAAPAMAAPSDGSRHTSISSAVGTTVGNGVDRSDLLGKLLRFLRSARQYAFGPSQSGSYGTNGVSEGPDPHNSDAPTTGGDENDQQSGSAGSAGPGSAGNFDQAPPGKRSDDEED